MSTSGIETMVLFSVPSPPHTPSHLSSHPPPTPLCLLHHRPHKKAASTSLTPWLLGSPPAPHQAFLHWKANLSSMHGWVPRVLAQSRPGHCPELEGIAMDWKAESLGRCFKVEEGRAMDWKGECNRDAAWGFKLLQALWLGLVLVWNNAFETRRSFLMSSFNRQVLDWLTQCSEHSAATSQFGVLGQKESANFSTRRIALVLPFVAMTSPALNSIAAVAPAKESDFGNSLLRNLGIGDADIYYPRIFEGLWSCYSTLVAVDTPQGEDKADQRSVEFARKQLGYTESSRWNTKHASYHLGNMLLVTGFSRQWPLLAPLTVLAVLPGEL